MNSPAPPRKKGTGALEHAPVPKLNWAETTAPRAPLQACGHSITLTERLPDCHQHFARLRCVICWHHLRWLPRPETLSRQRVNAFNLAKLAMCEGLNPWQRRFV